MRVYGALLARPGARALAFACAAGWLSFAGLGLAVVLLVEQGTGSFATAGMAVGALSAGAAVLAPLRGRIVDRRGGRALRRFAAAHAVALVALALSAGRGWPARRYVAGAVLFAVALAPGPLVAAAPGVAALAAQLALAGAGFGLLNVALLELLDRVADAGNAVEALTWLTSAEGAGVAAGAAVAGLLAARAPAASLALAAAAASLAAAVAVARRRTLERP